MSALLEVRALDASYDAHSQVLFGMTFVVREGEVVALLGRNGMGKTTTVRSIMGLIPHRRGDIVFAGKRIIDHPPEYAARLGIGLVPEGRQVFPNLSVEENLVATAVNRLAHPRPWSLERIYEMFPGLSERSGQRAGTLSGGEQQMLAIGRALMINPSLLILDEATEGLAPLVRREIWSCLSRLKQEKISILVIDKNLRALNRFADRFLLMEKGRITWAGEPMELLQNPDLINRHLGI